MMRSIVPALLISVSVASIGIPSDAAEHRVGSAQLQDRHGADKPWERLANDIGVRVAILDNNPTDCPEAAEDCFRVEITLTMPDTLPDAAALRGVRLYYGFVARLVDVRSDSFDDRHINGDLHELSLKPGAVLAPGSQHAIVLTGRGNFFSTSYIMPNFYLVTPDGTPIVLKATVPVVDRETGLETLPFVAPMRDERKLARGSNGDLTDWWTPARTYDRYAQWDAAAKGTTAQRATKIVPTPWSVRMGKGASVDLSRGVAVALDGVPRDAVAAALGQLDRSGARERVGGAALSIVVDPGLSLPALAGTDMAHSPDRYSLDVRADGILIRAASPAAASAALYGLAQQVAIDRGRIAPMHVEDAPRFGFRGLHIDIARNFHGPDELLAILDQMARYKLNTLHLHLADDEGWRLAIDELPELTEVGGFRCHDPAENSCLLPQLGAGPDRDTAQNGYLTRADFVALLKAAKARHIEVIPSFDMPGHSRAAIRSMEARYRRLMAAGDVAGAERYRLVEPGDTTEYFSIQNYTDNTLNPCLPATYRFFDTVLDSLVAMYGEAGVPLETYHIGADETAGAWTGSPACIAQAKDGKVDHHAVGAMFIERIATSLAKRGIRPAGWSDGMGNADPAKMPATAQANVWAMLLTDAAKVAHRQTGLGWRTVISVPDITYLDHPQSVDPNEPGYDWASRATDMFKVFGLMPENLPANASVMRDLLNRPGASDDTLPRDPASRFAGMQGHLWSETVRTDDRVEYMLFPRLLVLAERAWRRAPWEPAYAPGAAYAYGDGKVDMAAMMADWARLRPVVAAQLPLLDRDGIAYRVAPPGARIEGGKLQVRTELPGTTVEWRAAGGGAWEPYRGPVAVRGAVEVRGRSADGERAGRAVTVVPGERAD